VPRALRLTFGFEGAKVVLHSTRELEMLAPPSDALGTYEGRSGAWVELRTTAGETVYRRVLANLIRYDIEIVPEIEGGPFTRVPDGAPSGTFDVLVPVLAEAETVALFGPRSARRGKAGPAQAPLPEAARELVTHSLRDLPGQAG